MEAVKIAVAVIGGTRRRSRSNDFKTQVGACDDAGIRVDSRDGLALPIERKHGAQLGLAVRGAG